MKLMKKAMQASGTLCMGCISIMDGGHFSFLDADADLGTNRLALNTTKLRNITFTLVATRVILWSLECIEKKSAHSFFGT